MKTKLLRKIRKRYVIRYFPKGMPVYGLGVYGTDIYHVCENRFESYGDFKNNKNDCLEWILNEVRGKYRKYRKYSDGIKIWYNN